jgi:hypothetical protein
MNALKAATRLIAQSDPKTGFLELVVPILIPLLLKLPCFQEERETPATFLSKRRNKKGEYRPRVFRACRDESYKAFKEQYPDKEPTNSELDRITQLTLDKACENPELAAAVLYEFTRPNATLPLNP